MILMGSKLGGAPLGYFWVDRFTVLKNLQISCISQLLSAKDSPFRDFNLEDFLKSSSHY